MKKILFFFLFGPLFLAAQTVVDPHTFPQETNPNNSNFEFYSRALGSNKRATFNNVRKNMAPGIVAIGFTPSPSGNTSNFGDFVLDPSDALWYIAYSGDAVQLPYNTPFSAGTGISISGGNVISNTGDLSNTNELQTISIVGQNLTLSNGGGTVTIPAGATYTAGTGITILSNVVTNTGDLSSTNEGLLSLSPGTDSTAIINSNTSGSPSITFLVRGGLSIDETGNTIILEGGAGTGVSSVTGTDGNGFDITVVNPTTAPEISIATTVTGITYGSLGELDAVTVGYGLDFTAPTLRVDTSEVATPYDLSLIDKDFVNTSDATSHTVTLTPGGGSLKLAEGSNITLTTSGTGSDGIVTIASTASGTGTVTDFVFTDGNGFNGTVSTSTSTPTLELETTVTGLIYGGSGDLLPVTIGSGLSFSAPTLSAVDVSATNEAQTLSVSGTSTGIVSLNAISGTGGGTATFEAAGINSISQLGGTITITGTEVDGALANEGLLGVGAGSGTSSVLLSNTTGATGVTINASTGLSIAESPSSNGGSITLTNSAPDQTVSLTEGGIVDITGTYPNFTISATEVDGSTTNELQTIANTSNATSHTVTLSNSGGSVQIIEGTGIGLATGGTSGEGTVTVTNTAPDQTVSITGAGINAVTGTYPNFTVTGTEVDGSITNEGIIGVGAGGGNSATIISNTSTATGATVAGLSGILITESTSSNGGTVNVQADTSLLATIYDVTSSVSRPTEEIVYGSGSGITSDTGFVRTGNKVGINTSSPTRNVDAIRGSIRGSMQDRAGATYNVAAYDIVPDGTDQTAKIQKLLDTVYALGGGHIVFNPGTYRINGRLRPKDNYNGSNIPQTPDMWISGAAGNQSGNGQKPTGGTILDCRYQGDTIGCFQFRGTGQVKITDISFIKGTTGLTNTFIHSTLTTLKISDCAFWGFDISNRCRAIVLGGNTAFPTAPDSTSEMGFQGYGTVIQNNYFQNITTGVMFQTYANAVVVRDNNFWNQCGGFAAIWLAAKNDTNTGNVIQNNLIEMNNYTYGIYLGSLSVSNSIYANNFFDGPGGSKNIGSAATSANTIIEGFNGSGKPFTGDVDVDTRISMQGGDTSYFASNILYKSGNFVGHKGGLGERIFSTSTPTEFFQTSFGDIGGVKNAIWRWNNGITSNEAIQIQDFNPLVRFIIRADATDEFGELTSSGNLRIYPKTNGELYIGSGGNLNHLFLSGIQYSGLTSTTTVFKAGQGDRIYWGDTSSPFSGESAGLTSSAATIMRTIDGSNNDARHQAKDFYATGTGANTIPGGTDAQRPTLSGSQYGLRYNTTGSAWEGWNGSAWGSLATGGGGGTVTSVGLSLPAIFSVSGSPVTTSGTLTGTLATQTANTVFAGPTTGGAATPTFRALVTADLPATGIYGGSGTVPADVLATVTDSITFAGTDNVGGNALFNITATGSEPEILKLKGNTGHIMIGQGDNEYYMSGVGKPLGMVSDEFVYLQADSIQMQAVGTATRFEGVLGVASNNTVKQIEGTVAGQDLQWNGSQWQAGETSISPSDISGSNQNNYNPTGLSTADIIYVSSDADMYAITGMQTGAANREVTYINDGDYPLVFSAENTASTAANRFAGKTDFYCYPGKSITWIYDATASRWRAKGYSGEIDYSYAPMMARQYNGASSTAADWGNFTFIVSGTGATTPGASASSANVYSSYTPATGSTNAGVAGVAYNKNFLPYWGTAYRKNTAQVLIPTLSNSTDRYTLFFRESNTLAPTTLANNTIGIRYSDNVNSGKWECFVRNNSGTESVLDSGVTVSTSTIYNLEYIVCKGLNEVRFYINGVYVGSITTNMPTSGQVYVPHVTIVKSVGTASLGFSWMKGSTLYMY